MPRRWYVTATRWTSRVLCASWLAEKGNGSTAKPSRWTAVLPKCADQLVRIRSSMCNSTSVDIESTLRWRSQLTVPLTREAVQPCATNICSSHRETGTACCATNLSCEVEVSEGQNAGSRFPTFASMSRSRVQGGKEGATLLDRCRNALQPSSPLSTE